MENKKIKSQGPIRWNAIIPFIIFCTLIYLYFFLFFDTHMRKGLEWAGYQALGVEVNVGQFKSSFVKGNVSISKIQITSRDNPSFNSLELGDIRFDLNWGALLRVKFVVEELAVEGLQFMSKRAYPGRLAPPAPPSNEPGFVQQLQDKALNKLGTENENNVLGDTVEFLQTGQFDAQLQSIQEQLQSKKLFYEVSAKWQAKRIEWDTQIKALPSPQEVQALGDRLAKVKYKDFSSLQELDASVKEIDSLVKEIDAKSKQVQDLKSQLDSDLKSLDQDYKNLDAQIKKDIDTLKSRFKIPKIDAASFAKSMFMDYLQPIMAKIDSYRQMAQKYLPPKYAKMLDGQKEKSEPDDSIQPLPRTIGVSYEFPVKNGYPLFWIQQVKISSRSNAQVDYGDIDGQINHITSNQRQIGQPTTLKVSGHFNKQNIQGINLNALFNNMNPETLVKFDFSIGSYPLTDLKLIESKDGLIAIPLSNTQFVSEGEITGFKNYYLKLVNTFSDVNFQISSQNQTLQEVLNSTLGSINKFNLEASARGELKDLDIEIRSSLGGDLERAFQNLLQNKIKEANEKLQKAVNLEVDKLKAQLNQQVESIKGQIQSEIKKVQGQIDEQKKAGEQKITQAKKDFEDQTNAAKKKAEDEAKKKLEQEGKKQVDDLKKKFGL